MTSRKLRKGQASTRFLLGLLLIVFLLPEFTSRQALLAASNPKGKPYALIAGTVWGPDDRPVYGIPVKIRRAKDKKAEVGGLF